MSLLDKCPELSPFYPFPFGRQLVLKTAEISAPTKISLGYLIIHNIQQPTMIISPLFVYTYFAEHQIDCIEKVLRLGWSGATSATEKYGNQQSIFTPAKTSE